MAFSNEFLAAVGYGAIILIASLAQYYNRPRTTAQANPILAGIAGELGNREQMDRLIKAVDRVGDILEDKAHSKANDRIEDLTERVELLLQRERSRT